MGLRLGDSLEVQSAVLRTRVWRDVACFFFFQAEDGIRDVAVTGVQTCALPISVAEYCTPWIAVLAHLKGIKSPPQHAIAIERACWQGEAVAAAVAESRSQAEDAGALIEAEWEELPAVIDMDEALAGKRGIHPELGGNICF